MLQAVSHTGAYRGPVKTGRFPSGTPNTKPPRPAKKATVPSAAQKLLPPSSAQETLRPTVASLGQAPRVNPQRLHGLAAHLPNHGVPHALAYWAAAHIIFRAGRDLAAQDVIRRLRQPPMQEIIRACQAWAAARQKELEMERAKVPFWQRPGYDEGRALTIPQAERRGQSRDRILTEAIRAMAKASPPSYWVGMGRKELGRTS